GDRRWLDLSYKFEHESFIRPLTQHEDNRAGKHGNTQVPKLIGSADRFVCTGRAADAVAADFFWDRVVHHHSFATGGHGKDEYFHQAGRLSAIVDGRTCETCNVYNMLKLTRRLFALDPDPAYADFHERALFNHILASQDPTDGWACYMVPVGRRVQREYERNMLDGSFTCCTGSSLESHALHADGLYYVADDTLYVNFYAASTAQWARHEARLTVDTDLPLGASATLTMSLAHPRKLTLALRRPYWAGDGFGIAINGQALTEEELADPEVPALGRRHPNAPQPKPSSSYVLLKRIWRDGDTVEVTLPKALRLEPMPDNPRQVAILWGPLVLAGDLGPERDRRSGGHKDRIPAFVAAGQPVSEWLKPVDGRPGHFKTIGVGQPKDVAFMPFYQLHRHTYGVYWDTFTPAEWEVEQAAYAAEQERLRKLEAATVAYCQPGEMQPERNFNFQIGDERTWPLRTEDRPGRMARTWMSFDMPVESDHPMALVITYCSRERRRGEARFDIQVDGEKVASQNVGREEALRFYDVEYPLPASTVEGKQKVTVKFVALDGSRVAGVYGVRMIRADAER
ncbi:MAG: glycoside hydrolase family 127 protein, partial [Phycisphaerales bacterium]